MKKIKDCDCSNWLTEENLPSQYRKCEHAWRKLSKQDTFDKMSTHECVWCGLEKDESVSPVVFHI